jgi:hypothetical protein
MTKPFGILRNELRKHLTPDICKILINGMGLATGITKKLYASDEVELLNFLENSLLLTEKDVSPFLEVVTAIKDESLACICHILQQYQALTAVENKQDLITGCKKAISVFPQVEKNSRRVQTLSLYLNLLSHPLTT